MLDTSKLIAKVGSYRIATRRAVTDLTLLDIATQYESQVSRKMIALLPDQIPKRYTGSDFVLETTKVDGEGIFIYFERDPETLFAFNAPSGRVRVGLPALNALKDYLLASSIQKTLLRSELYLPFKIAGRRAGISEVVRLSFNGSESDIAAFKLLLLDIIMLNGKDLRPNQENFTQTWELLLDRFPSDPSSPFHCPDGSIVSESDLPQVFDRKVAAGEEGIVIRRLNRLEVCKIKPRLTIDAAVIGYVEGEYEGQYGVTSMLMALTYPHTDATLSFQTLLRVGSGLTDEQRAEYLSLFSQLRVDNPILVTDPEGRPVSFVRPEYIVEISAEDLMYNVPGADRPNRTQLFDWNPDQGSYQFLGLHPCPRPTFATFVRLRQDKAIYEGGARLAQIVSDPEKPTIQPPSTTETQIIRREVFTKGDMVRKLVVVQKQGEEEEVIPYLVYWTDFSPKRKDPLKVSVFCAITATRAEELATKLINENIVRGWHPLGQAVSKTKSTGTTKPKKTPKPPKTENPDAEEAKSKQKSSPHSKKTKSQDSPELES